MPSGRKKFSRATADARSARALSSSGRKPGASPSWHNAPVRFRRPLGLPGDRRARPGLAAPTAPAGLSPATRPVTFFTDAARLGFAEGVYEARPDDGLRLVGAGSSTRCAACRHRTSRRRSKSIPSGRCRRGVRGDAQLGLSWRWGASPTTHCLSRWARLLRRSSGMARASSPAGLRSSTATIARATTPIRGADPKMFRSVFAKVRADLDNS